MKKPTSRNVNTVNESALYESFNLLAQSLSVNAAVIYSAISRDQPPTIAMVARKIKENPMTETYYFPTLDLTEPLDLTTNVFPVETPQNRSLPMKPDRSRKTYATQRVLRESTAALIRRHFHLGAFLATILFSTIALATIYLYAVHSEYSYSNTNGILIRTDKTTGIREYQWPNQNHWTRLPAYTPTPAPGQTFSQFMESSQLGRRIKAKYPGACREIGRASCRERV